MVQTQRFILFLFNNDSPKGGWKDFSCFFPSVHECVKSLKIVNSASEPTTKLIKCDRAVLSNNVKRNYQIVDLLLEEIVDYGSAESLLKKQKDIA